MARTSRAVQKNEAFHWGPPAVSSANIPGTFTYRLKEDDTVEARTAPLGTSGYGEKGKSIGQRDRAQL